MFYPSLEKAKELSQDKNICPISLELMADLKTPIEVLRSLAQNNENYFILESLATQDSWSRYTFLGFDPLLKVRGADGIIHLQKNGESTNVIADPLTFIREILADYQSPVLDDMPPFTGGLVGYFSYEFMKYQKPAPKLKSPNPEGFDDFSLMLIDRLIAFDHLKQKMYLICNISTENLEQSYADGIATLKEMEQMVLSQAAQVKERQQLGEFEALMTQAEYCEKVERLQSHIRKGDIFQAVLSNRLSAPFKGSLLECYRQLRTTNPSPYMVYMNLDDVEIACSSPETLVALRGSKLSSFPLAGTRPRAESSKENAELEAELLRDEKELAEHDMLVDLGRNDIGKIAQFGSVSVEAYREVKHYSRVMHISSTVTGELKPGLDALDALSACLPAGTLSGAPKIKACELIDELEGSKRGLYGGAIGYIDFRGNADFCIGIRMAVRKGEKVYVQAGAGIVLDSVPEKEYEECFHKAGAILSALSSERRAR